MTCNLYVVSPHSSPITHQYFYYFFPFSLISYFTFCHCIYILLKLILCHQDVKVIWWMTCKRWDTWLTHSLFFLECGKLQFHLPDFTQLCRRTLHEAWNSITGQSKSINKYLLDISLVGTAEDQQELMLEPIILQRRHWHSKNFCIQN